MACLSSPGSDPVVVSALPAETRRQEDVLPLAGPGAVLVDADLSGRDLAFKDLSGAQIAGANLKKANLFGANLRGANLHGTQLDDADFTGADLRGANLESARGNRVGMSRADLREARLGEARLTQLSAVAARFDDADLRGADLSAARAASASFVGCDATGVRLDAADLSEVDVRGACFDHASLRGAEVRGMRDFAGASWLQADVRDISRVGASRWHRHVMDQNYLHEFRRQGRWNEFVYRLWRLTSDCGRDPRRWLVLTVLLTVGFGTAYQLVPMDYGPHPTALSPFYFSVVTMTTLGFGDAIPASVGAQLLVIAQVVIGYVMLGGLLSLLTNKMARRGE
ncbi:MAG: pentapeptide repeat-containing protein [Myxococcota bacterium]